MAGDVRKLDEIRARTGELENHYIDELVAGRIDRRQFLRRGEHDRDVGDAARRDPGRLRKLVIVLVTRARRSQRRRAADQGRHADRRRRSRRRQPSTR